MCEVLAFRSSVLLLRQGTSALLVAAVLLEALWLNIFIWPYGDYGDSGYTVRITRVDEVDAYMVVGSNLMLGGESPRFAVNDCSRLL